MKNIISKQFCHTHWFWRTESTSIVWKDQISLIKDDIKNNLFSFNTRCIGILLLSSNNANRSMHICHLYQGHEETRPKEFISPFMVVVQSLWGCWGRGGSPQAKLRLPRLSVDNPISTLLSLLSFSVGGQLTFFWPFLRFESSPFLRRAILVHRGWRLPRLFVGNGQLVDFPPAFCFCYWLGGLLSYA